MLSQAGFANVLSAHTIPEAIDAVVLTETYYSKLGAFLQLAEG